MWYAARNFRDCSHSCDGVVTTREGYCLRLFRTTPAAEALKVRFCRPHKMTASRTEENSSCAARQLGHQSEFIALNAIRTAHWITLPVCFCHSPVSETRHPVPEKIVKDCYG